MPIYIITGRLGSGKSLATVGRIRDLLAEGRPVATNLDLNLEKLCGTRAKTPRVVRLPDKPTVEHLDSLGRGNESYDETKNGGIFLDEVSQLLNARNWQDKRQQEVIDWLVHSRKKGWDVYFICQHISQVDRQVRDALVEYLVECRRFDRLKIPVVSGLVDTFTFGKVKLKLPRLHVAKVLYGTEYNAMVADRWWYRGEDLYGAYDTRQVFKENPDQAPFSYLPGWYTEGRLRPLRVRGVAAKLEEGRRMMRLLESGVIDLAKWRQYMAEIRRMPSW
ncbi:zonular occludens toxin [Ralstonia pickettii]|uniref:Zonular occludens toxin n=1 Tax=Ralstonia pickettii TaxID=329 RepID=A0A7X2HR50_RALPI|nr:zonular occludens toxin domain-containing protein [Ralstonia pickettii]MRT01156.1 zonular occludens toxin [Ralstonia pickettii]